MTVLEVRTRTQMRELKEDIENGDYNLRELANILIEVDDAREMVAYKIKEM